MDPASSDRKTLGLHREENSRDNAHIFPEQWMAEESELQKTQASEMDFTMGQKGTGLPLQGVLTRWGVQMAQRVRLELSPWVTWFRISTNEEVIWLGLEGLNLVPVVHSRSCQGDPCYLFPFCLFAQFWGQGHSGGSRACEKRTEWNLKNAARSIHSMKRTLSSKCTALWH